jgi:hypothetical protein
MSLNGTVQILYCIQVARSIDLKAAAVLLNRSRTVGLHHKTRILSHESPIQPPLRVDWPSAPIVEVGGVKTTDPDVAIYEQGILGITWSLDFEGTVDELVDLSAMLYINAPLSSASREVAEAVLRALEGAAARPELDRDIEDYVIFQLEKPGGEASEFIEANREDLARVLRAERRTLSAQEVSDALSERVSYTPHDACLVDWLGAVLIGNDTDDERMVLELATVQLLALRYLDRKLATSTEEAYELLLKPRYLLDVLGPARRDLARIAVMQTDDALIHEAIDNAIKVIGDDYLARLFATAGKRFRFSLWDSDIERKLDVLSSVYERLSDQASHKRAELLEWIIILLIAFEIGMALLGHA